MEQLEKDLQKSASDAVKHGGEKIKEFGSDLKKGVNSAGEKVEQYGKELNPNSPTALIDEAKAVFADSKERVMEVAENFYSDVSDVVRQKPVVGIFGAFAIGALAGALLFRSKSNN